MSLNRTLYPEPDYPIVANILGGVSAFSMIYSSYLLFHITYRKIIVNRTIRISMTLILLCSIIEQLLNIISFEIDALLWVENLAWIMVIILSYLQVHLNVHVLGMFSLLDDRLSVPHLNMFLNVIFVLFTGLSIPTLIDLFMDANSPMVIAKINQYTSYGILVGGCLINEAQAFYLAFMIFSKKANNKETVVLKHLLHILLINVALCMIDWIGLGIELLALVIVAKDRSMLWESRLLTQAASLATNIHAILSCWVFIQLMQLTFSGSGKIKIGGNSKSVAKQPHKSRSKSMVDDLIKPKSNTKLEENIISDDPRTLHQFSPNREVTLKELEAVGVESWNFNPDSEMDKVLALMKERNYASSDQITISKEKLPNYEEKLKIFFTEHLHDDEEIRYIMEGSGFFDIRDANVEWIRI